MKKFFVCMIILFMSSSNCFAFESINQLLRNHQNHETSIFTVLGALTFVIALIYLTGIIYTKLNVLNSSIAKKNRKSEFEDKVIVLSTTPLGNNKSLSVVEVNGKKMLIGVTQTSVTVLKDLGDVKYSNNDDYSFEPVIVEEESEKEVNEAQAGLDEIFSSNDVVTSSSTDDDDDYGLYKKYL